MTNKKKQRGRGRERRRGGEKATPKPAPSVGKEPDYYREKMKNRSAPDMTVIRRSEELKDMLFRLDARDKSATACRFVEAYDLLDDLEDRLLTGGRGAGGGGRTLSENEVPISYLVNDSRHLTNCAMLLRAMTLTNFRVPVNSSIVRMFPMPDCWHHITELKAPAGSSDEPQLYNVGAKEIVVLMSAAVALRFTSERFCRQASQIIHELRIHAENMPSFLDWDDLEVIDTGTAPPLTESDIRFALATIGIKATRTLYRNGDNANMQLVVLEKVKKRALFESIEVFAEDQVKYRPTCAVGYSNLAWVNTQEPRQRGTDGVTAAADCLHWQRKCYEVADAEDDDFLKAVARIDAAACLILGGGGIVGLFDGNLVERDMRSKKLKVLNGTILLENFIVRADTRQEQMAMAQNEKRRLAASIPETRLELGEVLLVAHWDVRRLWNEAMVSYDALTRWGSEYPVYGECFGWEAVVAFLESNKNNAYNQYSNAPDEPGFEAERDKGQGHRNCGWCGKYGGSEFNQCSRCKKACYCSKECAKKDWKKGGHKQRCEQV